MTIFITLLLTTTTLFIETMIADFRQAAGLVHVYHILCYCFLCLIKSNLLAFHCKSSELIQEF